MQHTEGKFNASDGLELYYQAWRPEGEPKAALAVVHGYGEHSGRYLNLVNYFAPRGYALYAYDLRGHGQSAGQRGHIHHFNEYLTDTDTFLKRIDCFRVCGRAPRRVAGADHVVGVPSIQDQGAGLESGGGARHVRAQPNDDDAQRLAR
jgi:alpha-beta hydrolase superfamily lysophospholipase